jgi:hypothetical protein
MYHFSYNTIDHITLLGFGSISFLILIINAESIKDSCVSVDVNNDFLSIFICNYLSCNGGKTGKPNRAVKYCYLVANFFYRTIHSEIFISNSLTELVNIILELKYPQSYNSNYELTILRPLE